MEYATLKEMGPFYGQREAGADLAKWLRVEGDLDDFIYYGEEEGPSER